MALKIELNGRPDVDDRGILWKGYKITRDIPLRGYEIFRSDRQPVAYDIGESPKGIPIKGLFISDSFMEFLRELK